MIPANNIVAAKLIVAPLSMQWRLGSQMPGLKSQHRTLYTCIHILCQSYVPQWYNVFINMVRLATLVNRCYKQSVVG